MHSHERTLLSKLGFDDPDKRNEEHDEACLYLTQDDVRGKILASLSPRTKGLQRQVKTVPDKLQADAARMEWHLQKGKDQFATTIGFLDVVFVGHVPNPPYVHSTFFFIEVKIEPIGVGTILRQMNLYKSYLDSPGQTLQARVNMGVVVTAWELDQVEADAIEQAGYACFHLGEGFRQWQAEHRNKKTGRSGI